MLPLLVTNMGDPKNPWDDVPIEVLIEHERKKREEWDRNRPRIEIDAPSHPPPSRDKSTEDDDEEEEHKIVIKLF